MFLAITSEMVTDIARDMIWVVIISAAPMLISSLIVGLVVSIFQTVTSIQEQTLTFVPKLLVIFIMLLLAGSWIMNNVVEFMTNLLENVKTYL